MPTAIILPEEAAIEKENRKRKSFRLYLSERTPKGINSTSSRFSGSENLIGVVDSRDLTNDYLEHFDHANDICKMILDFLCLTEILVHVAVPAND